MSDLIKFELTPNSKAVNMTTNDLTQTPDIDFSGAIIKVDNVVRIVEEKNPQDGLNVYMTDGEKYTIKPDLVTMVGATAGTVPRSLGLSGDPYLVYADNDTLKNALINLISW